MRGHSCNLRGTLSIRIRNKRSNKRPKVCSEYVIEYSLKDFNIQTNCSNTLKISYFQQYFTYYLFFFFFVDETKQDDKNRRTND